MAARRESGYKAAPRETHDAGGRLPSTYILTLAAKLSTALLTSPRKDGSAYPISGLTMHRRKGRNLLAAPPINQDNCRSIQKTLDYIIPSSVLCIHKPWLEEADCLPCRVCEYPHARKFVETSRYRSPLLSLQAGNEETRRGGEAFVDHRGSESGETELGSKTKHASTCRSDRIDHKEAGGLHTWVNLLKH